MRILLFCGDMTPHQEPITRCSGITSQKNIVLKTPTRTDYKFRSFHSHDHPHLFFKICTPQESTCRFIILADSIYLSLPAGSQSYKTYVPQQTTHPHTHIVGDISPSLHASLFTINIEFKKQMLHTNPRSNFL